jgi:hypothetical protein
MDSPFIREARLQEPADDGHKVRCLTRERRCLLADGQVGWCRTRQNRDGTIYTLIYGLVSSLSCNPIEKKPLYSLQRQRRQSSRRAPHQLQLHRHRRAAARLCRNGGCRILTHR